MSFQARQGDIFFEGCKKPDLKKMKRLNTNVIAHGELTGHSHQVITPAISECESYVDENGDIYILSKHQPIEIGHEEHKTITLPPNQWLCITRQREYDPIAARRERQVQD
jgi:hypothetical protein